MASVDYWSVVALVASAGDHQMQAAVRDSEKGRGSVATVLKHLAIGESTGVQSAESS